MNSPLVVALRIIVGVAISLIAVPVLIQSGVSRYAQTGAHTNWACLALGLALLTAGSFLIRPFWWRNLSRR